MKFPQKVFKTCLRKHFGRSSELFELQGAPHRESGQSLCVRDRRDKAAPPPPNSVRIRKNYRVGSRTEINVFTNGLRKAAAMTPSAALLKDMLVHKATHVFFLCIWGNQRGVQNDAQGSASRGRWTIEITCTRAHTHI